MLTAALSIGLGRSSSDDLRNYRPIGHCQLGPAYQFNTRHADIRFRSLPADSLWFVPCPVDCRNPAGVQKTGAGSIEDSGLVHLRVMTLPPGRDCDLDIGLNEHARPTSIPELPIESACRTESLRRVMSDRSY